MEVGKDNWCPNCMCWMLHDDDGKCVKCGTFINVKSKNHSWFEKFGVDQKELENESADF